MNPTAPDPLLNVVSNEQTGSVLAMQTGLFRLGHNRALASGTTEPKAEDLRSLEDHARAMAQETFREKFNPDENTHDRMHQAEYEKALAQRDDAEKGEQVATANLRDAEEELARTPKAGPRPALNSWLLAAFVMVFGITVAPTLHDFVFHTLSDDLLAWVFSSICGASVGCMLTWAILSGRHTKLTWIGVGQVSFLDSDFSLCGFRLQKVWARSCSPLDSRSSRSRPSCYLSFSPVICVAKMQSGTCSLLLKAGRWLAAMPANRT